MGVWVRLPACTAKQKPYNGGVDKLDSILLEAWNRMGWKLKKRRISALKRSRRRFKGVLTRPMREWCLVIRASDTRISSDDARIEVDPPDAIEHQEEHELLLTGGMIRDLTKPVFIPWPGVTLEEAAKLCGRRYSFMKSWAHQAARKGNMEIRRRHEFRFPPPRLRKGSGLTWDGKPEKPNPRKPRGGRPYVWTACAIDPNNFEGRRPHPVWGTLWQTLWKRLPVDYVLRVKRVPVFRNQGRGNEPIFRGWSFICPGRLDENREYKGCGRTCRYLYGPQTVWTLCKSIPGGTQVGFDMPEGSGLAGQWIPGLSDLIQSTGPRSFACKTCWNVRSACMANHNGWNEFIAQISGGLLYGRDVPRLPEICPVVRKKPQYTWKKRRRRGATVTADAMELKQVSA